MVEFLSVRTLSRELSAAARLGDVAEALRAVASHFQLSHLLVAEAPSVQDAPMRLDFSSVPNVTFDLLMHHPLVVQAQRSDVPFGLAEAFRQSGMSAADWSLGLPPGFEALDGAVVPVHDDGRLAWWVCFAGERPALDRRAMCMLAAASYAARARASALGRRTVDKRALTARETTCLRLAATGKSDQEVGEMLGISGRTVRFHITNAKDKLGARTRLQAVARVMDMA